MQNAQKTTQTKNLKKSIFEEFEYSFEIIKNSCARDGKNCGYWKNEI